MGSLFAAIRENLTEEGAFALRFERGFPGAEDTHWLLRRPGA